MQVQVQTDDHIDGSEAMNLYLHGWLLVVGNSTVGPAAWASIVAVAAVAFACRP